MVLGRKKCLNVILRIILLPKEWIVKPFTQVQIYDDEGVSLKVRQFTDQVTSDGDTIYPHFTYICYEFFLYVPIFPETTSYIFEQKFLCYFVTLLGAAAV